MANKRNVFEDIVTDFKKMIEMGVLQNGEKLPSVRVYALERRVNPNTVAKAYAKLEEEGYIKIFLKKGGYVSYVKEEQGAVYSEIKRRVKELLALGVSKHDLESVIEEINKEESAND